MGNTLATKDGTQIYFKDGGTGQRVVFSHGWPLSADACDDQMLFLGTHGFRVIAHDPRGHGRSRQPWNGNDLDTYAEDLRKLRVPTLFIHGDDDPIVPIGASAHAAVKIAPPAKLKVYPGAPHGLCSTHRDQVNADLLDFLK